MKEENFRLECEPILEVSKQNMFTTEQIYEMHNGIKYAGKLKEYFEETKERLKEMHTFSPHQHTEEELDAGTAVVLVWPFLGEELLDSETVFSNAELILALIRDEINN